MLCLSKARSNRQAGQSAYARQSSAMTCRSAHSIGGRTGSSSPVANFDCSAFDGPLLSLGDTAPMAGALRTVGLGAMIMVGEDMRTRGARRGR